MSPTRRKLDFLPRVLSKWGHCSRRDAERLVVAGRVTVNGIVRRFVLDEVDPERDEIAVDGAPVRRASFVYLKLHKPLGVVTTMKDPEGRPTIAELIPPHYAGVMPVGRLDQDSTGLLLLTNDHALGNLIAGPEHRVDKVYRVEVRGAPEDELFEPVRRGIVLAGAGGEERCRPAEVTLIERRLDPRNPTTLLEIVLQEGRFRQIRRSLEAIGLRVVSLHRIRIGPIELGKLAPGASAPLSEAELGELRAACDATA